MSYIVKYNKELRKIYPKNKETAATKTIKYLSVSFAILIAIFILKATGILRYIIPGEPAITTGAFSDMVTQVQSGQTVSEAIFTFFKTVITSGI